MIRTDYVARTAKGVLIRTFENRSQAMVWAEIDGHEFPGFIVSVVTEQTLVTERVLRRDRSHLREIAA